jgi:hypothetical protein
MVLLGSKASRRPSPRKLRASRVVLRREAGKTRSHQRLSRGLMTWAPCLSREPQLAAGSSMPRPRKLRKDSVEDDGGDGEGEVGEDDGPEVGQEVARP